MTDDDGIFTSCKQIMGGGEEVERFAGEGPDSAGELREWYEARGVKLIFPTFELKDEGGLLLTFVFSGTDKDDNEYVVEAGFFLGDSIYSVLPALEEVLQQFA